MKFQKSQNKVYFNDIKNLNETRKLILDDNKTMIDEIKQKMFDLYDVENMFVINEFLDKDVYNVEYIPLLFSLSKGNFEDLVENKQLKDFYSNNIKLNILVENKLYIFDEYWHEIENKILKKLEI